MSNPIDQIEIKFKDGAPLWVYVQEIVSLVSDDGAVSIQTVNRLPIQPDDPRVTDYFGKAVAKAIEKAQEDEATISKMQTELKNAKDNNNAKS